VVEVDHTDAHPWNSVRRLPEGIQKTHQISPAHEPIVADRAASGEDETRVLAVGGARDAYSPAMRVRPLLEDEREWLKAVIRERWNGGVVVGRGTTWTPGELPAVVAVDDTGSRVGVATYAVEGESAELVTVDALVRGVGAGRMLVEAVAAAARDAGARRLRVMTTNDNFAALRLYQRAGFRLTTLRPGAVEEARRRKPSIPVMGQHGIPLRDELDLERDLGG
jgi:ribosomal protein S18 acetylase RimI-like enzyme